MSRARPRRKSNRGKIAGGLLAVVIVLIGVVAVYQMSKPGDNDDTTGPTQVLFNTSKGNFVIELYDDMPITTNNFKVLVDQGKYDSTVFHRIVTGFVVQGGQVQGGWHNISDELPNKHSNVKYAVAMAKSSDPNSGGALANSATSEFFIDLDDNVGLDAQYSVFGHVVSGMDVVNLIGTFGSTGTEGTPTEKILVYSATVIAS